MKNIRLVIKVPGKYIKAIAEKHGNLPKDWEETIEEGLSHIAGLVENDLISNNLWGSVDWAIGNVLNSDYLGPKEAQDLIAKKSK